MHVPGRTPGAHQVAASQDKHFKGCNVFVESGCDCRFWKNFLDVKMVKMRACGGWPHVLESVRKGTEANEVCIGIIDRDFRDFVENYGDVPENVFVSDEHDVEMMIVKAEGISRVVNNFDAEDHIEKFEEKEGKTVLEAVFDVTNKIGILKLIDRRDKMNFKLRKKGKKTEFDLPNYERFLDKDGQIVSDEKMIDYLISWSIDNKSTPTASRESIIERYRQMNPAGFDPFKLSSGHDVTYIISYLIWKHISGEKTDKEEIERLLRASYTSESFQKTQIYGDMAQWCVDNNMVILK